MKNTNTTIIIILLLILGFGGYTYVKNKNQNYMPPTTTTQNSTTNTPAATAQPQSAPPIKASLGATIASTVKEFTVSGKNFSFTPNKISVKKGDTVKITFKNSDGFHDLSIDEYNVATSKIASGAEENITFVADKAGSFVYYCSVGQHRAQGMWGTLTVE